MKYKAMKFWIGAEGDPRLSRAVRSLLDALGYNIRHAGGDRAQVIITEIDGTTNSWDTHRKPESLFSGLPEEEINIDWMRSIKPETITIEGLSKTYIKSELEEALRHIKPVGEE